jgi:hypothetical protein
MEHRLAFASFRIGGSSLNESEWTEYFGVQPTEFHSGPRGDCWWIESSTISDDLEPHVLELIDILKLPRLDLPAKAKAAGVTLMDFFCFWEVTREKPQRSKELSNQTAAILRASVIAFGVDIYKD